MPTKRILIFGFLGLVTGFFSMYGYLASYTYLGKLFGDGTPYFLALVGMVAGVFLSFKNKKTILSFALPIWFCILLGFMTLAVLNAYQMNEANLDIISPIVTAVGIAIGLVSAVKAG